MCRTRVPPSALLYWYVSILNLYQYWRSHSMLMNRSPALELMSNTYWTTNLHNRCTRCVYPYKMEPYVSLHTPTHDLNFNSNMWKLLNEIISSDPNPGWWSWMQRLAEMRLSQNFWNSRNNNTLLLCAYLRSVGLHSSGCFQTSALLFSLVRPPIRMLCSMSEGIIANVSLWYTRQGIGYQCFCFQKLKYNKILFWILWSNKYFFR